MFLKSLTLKGFKSFADSSTLQMEPGVTVVVGPNGSGKSNIVDAIGWVLGAQAPSTVRSQKMDDVIFAGTSKRSALGRAEVSLTIDNSGGQLPIEFNEVTITRTLFRSGDSEYSINNVPCRLLDVQELLSDSGVGRQQHVIISQGQIDAVLNARPEDRRLIIEEAAGVLKYRRRKEKAERRLTATEGNLTRIDDLLREVRRQLRPLEKQADAARRHLGLATELRELRVHLAGRDVARLTDRLTGLTKRSADLTGRELETRRLLASLDARVLGTEAELTAMGGHDLSDSLGRYESLRERVRGLTALVAERRRGVERDRMATIDRAVVANLEAEAASLAVELADVEQAATELDPAARRLAEAEANLEDARTRFRSEWADGVEPPSGQAAEVRGELSARRAAVQRATAEVDRIEHRAVSVGAKTVRLAADLANLKELAVAAEVEGPQLLQAVEHAGTALVARQAAAVKADESRRVADGEVRAWTARAEALASALDAARARAGAQQLADLDGVVGTLLDIVHIDDGWQTAFESAAGEAIAAVVVDDVSTARRALVHLRTVEVAGAVIPLGRPPTSTLPSTAGETLRSHVRSTRPEVDSLLDLLVGHTLVADDWSAAVDLATADPGVTVVTRSGDRLGPDGWRVGGTSAGATGAALTEAEAAAAAATGIAADSARRAVDAQAAADDARRIERDAVRALETAQQLQRSRQREIDRLRADHGDVVEEEASLGVQITELRAGLDRDELRVTELTLLLPQLELEESEIAQRARAMAAARTDLEARSADVSTQKSEFDVRAAGLTERRAFLQRRAAEIEERLVRDEAQRRQAEARRLELDRTATAFDRFSALLTARTELLDVRVADLREQRRRQTDVSREVAMRLEALRKERADHERTLEATRTDLQRAGLEGAEVKVRLEQVVETLRTDLEIDPDAAIVAPCPDLGEGVSPVARVRELDRELRLMGSINPLALEEFEAMSERHRFLNEQLDDVKSTRRDLGKVIKGIDAEIVTTFASAYSDVEANFRQLFEMLFPGGVGGLKLTNPEDPLTTGIEIEARPSGKNVRKLSLLSGGERSLVALAYLFAVFRSRPSPFYVMDEVEAALDDVNLHRFLDLVQEFRSDAQLIVVSHQKRTMEAADCLYGVSMQPGGSSKVVSERAGDS